MKCTNVSARASTAKRFRVEAAEKERKRDMSDSVNKNRDKLRKMLVWRHKATQYNSKHFFLHFHPREWNRAALNAATDRAHKRSLCICLLDFFLIVFLFLFYPTSRLSFMRIMGKKEMINFLRYGISLALSWYNTILVVIVGLFSSNPKWKSEFSQPKNFRAVQRAISGLLHNDNEH